MRHGWLAAGALIATLLAACNAPPTREQAGMVAGGIAGGVVGSEISGHSTAGAIIGTLVGGAVGGLAGRAMDESDRRQTVRVLETVPTGTSSNWRNPDTGNSYAVTPVQTFDMHGAPCRKYVVNAMVAGRPEKVSGTACRQSDGNWRAGG